MFVFFLTKKNKTLFAGHIRPEYTLKGCPLRLKVKKVDLSYRKGWTVTRCGHELDKAKCCRVMSQADKNIMHSPVKPAKLDRSVKLRFCRACLLP